MTRAQLDPIRAPTVQTSAVEPARRTSFALMAVNRDVIGQAETLDRTDRVVLDMDSSDGPGHGQQEGSAYNGHFESVCYHPLFLFNDHADCLAAKPRPGNVSSADDWEELILPEIDRVQLAESVAAARPADADRYLVLDQHPATPRQDGWRLVKHARYYWLLWRRVT